MLHFIFNYFIYAIKGDSIAFGEHSLVLEMRQVQYSPGEVHIQNHDNVPCMK